MKNYTIVNNKEEFIKLVQKRYPPYQLKGKLKVQMPDKKDYPKSYPSIVEQIEVDGGLMGDYVRWLSTPLPVHWEDHCLKAFIKGFETARENQHLT